MLPITYGTCPPSIYVNAGMNLCQTFQSRGMSAVVEEINTNFFTGGVFAPKSFSALASVEMPAPPFVTITGVMITNPWVAIEIRTQQSESAKWGYMEAMPPIGSVLAVIGVIGHLFYMIMSYRAFKRAVSELIERERATSPTDRDMPYGNCVNRTHNVFTAAFEYTDHSNHLTGSLLSIFPLVKPVVRLTQWLVYKLCVQ